MAHLASVLLIEDNAGDTRLVREYLSERFGASCELHAAATLDTGLQGGRIWADSRSGDSTRFYFKLEGTTRAGV